MAKVLSYLNYLKYPKKWYLWKSLVLFYSFVMYMDISVLFMIQKEFGFTDNRIEKGCL